MQRDSRGGGQLIVSFYSVVDRNCDGNHVTDKYPANDRCEPASGAYYAKASCFEV